MRPRRGGRGGGREQKGGTGAASAEHTYLFRPAAFLWEGCWPRVRNQKRKAANCASASSRPHLTRTALRRLPSCSLQSTAIPPLMLRHVSSLAAPQRSVNTLCTAVTARAFSVDASGPAAKKPRNTQPNTPLPVPGVRPHDQKSRPTVVFDRSRPPYQPSSVKPPLKSTSAQSSSSKFKSTKPSSKFASTRPPSSGPPRTKPLYGKPPAEKPLSTKSRSYGSSPSRITNDGPKRLLRAPVLAQRLQILTEQGRLEEAADMLQNTPLDAQNTVVWNGLLKDFLRAEKYQRAFELYVDVSRAIITQK